MVVISKNPVHSVLWLVAVFFTISGPLHSFECPVSGDSNLIVYAGAIMVLFLFIIMLMNLNADTEPQKNKWLKIAGTYGGRRLLLYGSCTFQPFVFSAVPYPHSDSSA